MTDTDWKYAGVVSEGTLLESDLIPRFLEAFAPNMIHADWREWPTGYDDDGTMFLLEDLFDALNTVGAEHGYSFGASDGDGACFGFWAWDEDEAGQ